MTANLKTGIESPKHPLVEPMNTKSLFIALLGLLGAFSACKDTNDDVKYSVPRIKKMAWYENNQLYSERTYQYDGTGRLVKESITDDYDILYTYLPGKVIIKVVQPGTEDMHADTVILNDKGLQISTSNSSAIEYDALGYLVKKILLVNKIPHLHTFRIENGNTVQWTLKKGGPPETIVNEQTYEFLPNTVNTIGNDNTGIPFYGKQNKNLLSKTTFISHSSTGTDEFTVSYDYELDTQNRVVKQTMDDGPGRYMLFTYYD